MGKEQAASDDLLLILIRAATQWIDEHCDRRFARNQDEERTFDPTRDVEEWDENILHLGDDLHTLTQVLNGDGADITALVTPEPRHQKPHAILRLKSRATTTWTYPDDGDPENSIRVIGRWTYSVTAPEDIALACMRLVQYLYWQRQAPLFETTAIPEMGMVQVPPGMPADARNILEQYKRQRFDRWNLTR